MTEITIFRQNPEGFLAMEFLKNVSQGDKRILVLNGQILASSLRLPAEESWLCNVAQGGHSVAAEATSEEIKIIETISPKLLEAGILIFGVDTLVANDGKRILSEINTLSIGGFPQAEKQTKKPILQQTINGIIKYVDTVFQNQL
jgi:glutathione synthase